MDHWPPISILVPCHNEAANAEETLGTAAAVDYPDFEVIAINDGSRGNTAEVLDELATRILRLRVVHLAANQGKATALNVGALMARNELLVCIDGDALIDPQALRWIARVFRRPTVGGLAGNPRIRNRTSLLGRLQVGEFSSIIGLIRRAHRRCQENGIEHRLTKVKHPWTNGQVERMNRTLKEATVQRYHYDSHQQLEAHLADFVSAYNFGRRLKTLRGLTPYEFICKTWTKEPQRFRLDPLHQMPGLNT
jgi:glycosyltransferase involved in cell wall biosynthesis